MNKKGYLEISFSWIFAILVGGFIIFLAISTTGKILDSQAMKSDVVSSKELANLLSPLESGFEDSKTSAFMLPKESNIFFRCESFDTFGTQLIVIQSENFNKKSNNNLEISLENKYVFAEKNLEGKTFNILAKQFAFPFKAATLIYVTPADKNYCFIDASRNMQKDIENMKTPEMPQYLFTKDCPNESITVCFSDDDCDINVKYSQGELEKGGKTFYFEGDALMYGAIFSEKTIYDCQVQRLMKRVAILSNVYIEKAVVNPRNGCDQENQEVNSKLRLLEDFANNFKSPEDLILAIDLIQDIENKNKVSYCKLW